MNCLLINQQAVVESIYSIVIKAFSTEFILACEQQRASSPIINACVFINTVLAGRISTDGHHLSKARQKGWYYFSLCPFTLSQASDKTVLFFRLHLIYIRSCQTGTGILTNLIFFCLLPYLLQSKRLFIEIILV